MSDERTWVISVLSSACGSTLFADASGEERDGDGWGVANALAEWWRACRVARKTLDVALDHIAVIYHALFFPADAKFTKLQTRQ